MFWVKQKTDVKNFNTIAKINGAKTLVKHISCDCNWKCNSTACNSNQKWNNGNGICENSRYLKSHVHNSVILCNDMNGTDITSKMWQININKYDKYNNKCHKYCTNKLWW